MTTLKLSTKQINKLVSFVDQHFAYDHREIKREDHNELWDLYVRDDDRKIVIVIDNTPMGVYLSITKNDNKMYRCFAHSFNELNIFKKMILCLE